MAIYASTYKKIGNYMKMIFECKYIVDEDLSVISNIPENYEPTDLTKE